jgi:putative MATE family efflux protein
MPAPGSQTLDMTSGPPLRLLTRFAVPLMLGSAFQLLYTLADGAVVGRLIGVGAFAAVGASSFAHWLVLSAILGLTQGFGVRLAQRFGARDAVGLRAAYRAAVGLAVLLGVALSVAGPLLTRPVLALLHTPPDILEDASAYFSLLTAGLAFSFLYNAFGSALRALGNSRAPLMAMVLSSVLNVGLDLCFVGGLHMGVAGAALATVLAQGAAVGICWARLRGVEILRGEGGPWFAKGELGPLMRLGGPAALRNAVTAAGGLVMQAVVNGYGAIFIAGVAAAWKLYGLLEVIGGGYEGAVATFVAQNHGAKRQDRVRQGVARARTVLLAASVVSAAAVVLLGQRLLGLLLAGEDAPAALAVGQNQLTAMAAFLPTLYLLLLYRAALQGSGDALRPMVSGFVELAVRVAGILILPRWLGHWGVYWAEVAGWPVAAAQLMVGYFVRLRQKPK